MKIAFISDIHGNAIALDTVLHDISLKSVDKIIVLGDISFRGPEPKRSIDIIRSLDSPTIKGNADEWIIRGINNGEVPNHVFQIMQKELQWTKEKLEINDFIFLKNLPNELTINLSDSLLVHCFHATPDNLFEVVSSSEEDSILSSKLMNKKEAHIYIYGHTHKPYIKFFDNKCVANTGSVGLPLDGPAYSSYLILENENDNFYISIQKVKYDVDKVITQLKESNYPNIDFFEQTLASQKL